MKTKIIFLILIAWLLIIGTNCKKERPTYFMPQEFKDYVVFPVGSYWIYEDSFTNNFDSISLFNTTVRLIDDDKLFCTCKYESITQNFYSSFSNESFIRFIEPFLGDFENKYAYYLSSWSGYIFLYPQSSYGKYFSYKYFNSLHVNDTIYENVHVFERKIPRENILINYFAKHVGIIKKKIITINNDTTVWELKNYHINN